MKPQIKAIYISVKNMDRAVKFYEDLFETPERHQERSKDNFQ